MPSRRVEIEPFVVRGEFHHRLTDGRVQCDICPRACMLREGQRAFCFVRMARGGDVVLTSYGRSTGFCIDPIEKKPLNHFYPGTAILSFGTAGCNLGCKFCQNWDLSKAREIERLASMAYPDDIAEAATRVGAMSVAFTYNDPVIFLEYAVDAAQACREQGVQAVAVTAGYIAPAARKRFFASMDAANIDLKAFTERFYEKLCYGALAPIQDTLVYLKHETDVWFEITTLLIPGENDSEDEIAALCDWVVAALGPDVPLHFSAFHPDFKLLDRERTPAATLARARRQALGAGLRYVYTGNIHDPTGQSTTCVRCGALLIERDGYELGRWGLDTEGRCNECGAVPPGRFGSRPGHWGARRQPVRIASDP